MSAESAGRALWAKVAKFKHTKDIGYNAYTKLYECGGTLILDYAAEVCLIRYILGSK